MKDLQEKINSLMRFAWGRSTFVGIVCVATLLIPLRFVDADLAWKVSAWLSPIFILYACVGIYLIETETRKLQSFLEANVERELTLQSFSSGEEFDDYLAHRLNSASELKVIHLSSFSSSAKSEEMPGERRGRRYSKILDRFIKSGRVFQRILCETSNCDVFDWIVEDLKKYEEHKYFIHFLHQINIDGLRTLGIMIIDEDEVCLGGGYKIDYKHQTISLRGEVFVRFFLSYFQYLLRASKPISTRDGTDWEYVEKVLADCRAASISKLPRVVTLQADAGAN